MWQSRSIVTPDATNNMFFSVKKGRHFVQVGIELVSMYLSCQPNTAADILDIRLVPNNLSVGFILGQITRRLAFWI